MCNQRKRHYVKLVIIEPLPFFLGDPRFTDEQALRGPFYAPGFTKYELNDKEGKARAYLNWSAEYFRAKGFTCLVLDEHR